MAIEIPFNASVDVGDGAKSLRSLKQEFKETQKELDGLTYGSEKYVQTLKKLGAVKDEIGDLNNEIKAFNPEGKVQALTNVMGGLASGFAAAQGAAALFGGESKELEKTLVKVQAAMALSQGIQGIVGLADGFKVLKNIVQDYITQVIGAERVQKIAAIATRLWNAALEANPITIIVGAVAALTAGVYLLSKAFSSSKSSVEQLTEQYDNLKKANEELNHEYDNEIKLLESLGGKEKEINQLKREKLILMEQEAIAAKKIADQKLKDAVQESSLLEKSLLLFGNAGLAAGVRGKAILEANEEVKKSDQAVEDARINIEVLDNERARKQAEAAQKAADKAKSEADKKLEEHQKYLDAIADQENAAADRLDQLQKEANDAYKALQEQVAADEAAQAEENFVRSQTEFVAYQELVASQNQLKLQAQLDFLNFQMAQELANVDLTESQKLLIIQQYADKEKAIKQQARQNELNAASQLTSSLASLSDSVFSIKRANLKKGSAEDLAQAKKQFNINKGLSIASATISGIQGVVNALSAQSMIPEPAGTILKAVNAVAVGAAAVANIAKISKTKFDDGGGGGGSVAAVASPQSVSAPSINAPSNSSTLLNPDGSVQNNNTTPQVPMVKAIVTETDITATQKRVNTIQEQATIK